MMGTKERNFAPLDRVSLEELVPEGHFYRQLNAALDLSFARDLVKDRYAVFGRPSVDPVVFACSWSCSSRTSAQSGSLWKLRRII